MDTGPEEFSLPDIYAPNRPAYTEQGSFEFNTEANLTKSVNTVAEGDCATEAFEGTKNFMSQ